MEPTPARGVRKERRRLLSVAGEALHFVKATERPVLRMEISTVVINPFSSCRPAEDEDDRNNPNQPGCDPHPAAGKHGTVQIGGRGWPIEEKKLRQPGKVSAHEKERHEYEIGGVKLDRHIITVIERRDVDH